jgi:hypothetical protein
MRNQQADVYAAERTLSWPAWLGTIDDARLFLMNATETEWWSECVGDAVTLLEIELSNAAATSSARGHTDEQFGVITFSVHQLTDKTAVHELAHVLADVLHGSESHDPWWARVYLELVSLMVGSQQYRELELAFFAHSIEVATEGLVFRRKDVIAL